MTTKSDRFFVWVWRTNGLIVLAAASLALFAISAVTINVGVFASRDTPETQHRDVAGADLVAEDLMLGSFRDVEGTDFLIAELAAPARYVGSGSSGGLGTARNLLFSIPSRNRRIGYLPIQITTDRRVGLFSIGLTAE